MSSRLDPFGLWGLAGESLRRTGRALDWVESQVVSAISPGDQATAPESPLGRRCATC